MRDPAEEARLIAADVRQLHSMGYGQELLRRMSGFSNFAISFSIICILAGGITSFHLGLSGVGGAALGIGWPLGSLLALAFAATMAQVASAFPTAGGLYHWASVLGGRGWGWATAWFNLAGLITVLAAINVGTFQFLLGALGPRLGYNAESVSPHMAALMQTACVCVITFSQALFNHLGIRVTTLLTDFSGYWILIVVIVLTIAMLSYAPGYDLMRLVTFKNYSGLPEGHEVWPATQSVLWLFALGFLLPAYTITGFDASAHTSEETVSAARNVPKGIIRSVLVSGIFGWVMLCAIVLAIPDLDAAAAEGDNAFYWIMRRVLPPGLTLTLYLGIGVAQYICGLATVTSASRMTYAFARDGGLPFSHLLRRVSPRHRTPEAAIWTVAVLTVAFTIWTPVYTTITTVCVIFLYLSYTIPTILGYFAYGRTWTHMGPWSLGRWYRVLAVVRMIGCVFLVVIGVQPPNDKALWIILGAFVVTVLYWFGFERHTFKGPPLGVLIQQRQAEIEAAEKAVGEVSRESEPEASTTEPDRR